MIGRAKYIVFAVVFILVVAVCSVYAQTFVVSVRGIPKIVGELADQVIFLLEYKKLEINWDKTHISSYPDGSNITLEDDSVMTKEEWITTADAVLLDIQSRIDAINNLK